MEIIKSSSKVGFEDIIAWKKARTLCKSIYQEFRSQKDSGFRDQIQRAAISIMNNVAEGFDRNSKKDFIWFLRIAKASSAEVKSMLYVASDIHYLQEKRAIELAEQAEEISKIIMGLIKSLRRQL